MKVKTVSILVLALITAFSVLAENKITLKLLTGGNKPEMNVTREIINSYMEKHPGIEVKIVQIPNKGSEAYSYILQLFEAKTSEVDILRTDIVWVGDLEYGLLDLNKYVSDKIKSKIFPQLIENNTVNGKLVALPMYVDVGMLFYRKDLLKKYNLEVPETWTELTKAAYKIRSGESAKGNKDFEGYMWDARPDECLTTDALELIHSCNGGSIVSKDKIVTVNNQNAAKILSMAAKWMKTITPLGVTVMESEQVRSVFQSGNAAFMRNFPYAYVLSQQEGSKVKGKVGIAPLPHGVEGTSSGVLGGYQVSISKYTKHPKEAADFLIYYVSKKAQKMRAVKCGNAPAIPALYKDKDILKKNPEYSSIYKALLTAVPRPSTQCSPKYTQVSITFYKAVYDILVGKKTAQVALMDAAHKISEITGYKVAE